MEVYSAIHIDPSSTGGPSVVSSSGGSLVLKVPDPLCQSGFPAREVQFEAPNSGSSGSKATITSGAALEASKNLPATMLDGMASSFNQKTNNVVFSFGTGATSKRNAIVSPKTGVASTVLSKIVSSGSGDQQQPLIAFAYALDNTETLQDLVNPSNLEAKLTETVREGPRVNDLTIKTLASASDVSAFFGAVSAACDQAKFLNSSFVHHAIVITALRYENSDGTAAATSAPGGPSGCATSEMNSIHFIVLPDNQRPLLLGVDASENKRFDFAQKCIAGAAGVIAAIIASRLRVPFGKSRLTGLLKRTYNAERGNAYNSGNRPTATHAIVCVSAAEEQAEESYHIFALLKRIFNPTIASSSSLTLTRDMLAEKWRLEQDIIELRDELGIAKQVFGYKPCIVEQAKPVANIHDEEQKRIAEILKKREEARIKQQQELEQRAKTEAAMLIEQEEKSSGITLRELEDQVSRVRRDYENAEAEHAKKRQEHEKHTEKIRRKRTEEEDTAEQLRQQVAQLEDEISSKENELQRRKRQIESANQDAVKSRESAQKEREDLHSKRKKLQQERQNLRANWLEEIRSTNERLLSQVASLETARKKLIAVQQQQQGGAGGGEGEASNSASAAATAASGGGGGGGESTSTTTTNVAEYETENGVREDIKSIDEYLPRLIALEDVPAEIDQSEAIRKQLEEYFEQEKSSYATRLEQEKERLSVLEKELKELRGRAKEVSTSRRKELLGEAVKKEHHVQSIIDQVLQYLQNGVRLQKVSSNGQVRRRLFFISENCKNIFACDLDETGAPINRRKPTMTIAVSDIERITLGIYTSSFLSFTGKVNIKPQRDEAMKDSGSTMTGTTAVPVTPTNLGKYNYRSFALHLRQAEKTVELVCDTDSDWEAWLLALKRLVSFKTAYERKVDQKCGRPCPEPTADIRWGDKMEMRGRNDYELLYPEELKFCAENHVPPRLFIKTRDDVKELSKQMIVTVYDIRKSSSMDLLRSQAMLDHLVDRNIVPSIYG